MNRVLAAARLQLIRPLVALGVPWLVVGISFAVNWLVWSFGDLEHQPGAGFTGGVLSLYITVAIVYLQAVTQFLPFAMGVSASRRAFYAGTALMGVVQAVGYGIALAVLTAVEGATAGWGVGLQFWAPAGMDVDTFLLQIVVSGAPMLAFMAIGAGVGVVQKRWGSNGLWSLGILVLVVVGGLAVLITALGTWVQVGSWFADRSVLTLTVTLPAAVAVVLAGLSWAGLRRAVP